ncbi:MAG TPA: hypothetical protein VK911_00230, partial [Vicinamibacterales bacterium]|nr:hypothetical protein [Vicinamibacterales bacterium]
GEYLASYAPRISGVTLEEEYTLLEVSGGRLGLTRRIISDVVLLNHNGGILGLRDPFAVDGNSLRDRAPRITTLLAKPSEAAWARAMDYTRESMGYFQDDLILRLNEPTLALRFLALDNQTRLTYKIDGRKKIAGVETVVLKFQETRTKPPAYILDTPGKAIASGKFWIDPATGRIHRTELSVQADSEGAHIVVDYAHQAALDLWLPSSMADTYEATERVGPGMNNMGAGSPGIARRSFDCRAVYSNARQTPIDLSIRK